MAISKVFGLTGDECKSHSFLRVALNYKPDFYFDNPPSHIDDIDLLSLLLVFVAWRESLLRTAPRASAPKGRQSKTFNERGACENI